LIQSLPSHPTSIRSILICPPIYVLVFQVVSFLLAFPSHPPWLDHSNYAWRKFKLWSSSLCSFLHPPVTSSLFGPNILLNTLFSNTLSLCKELFL
jgi:hypothetical protein